MKINFKNEKLKKACTITGATLVGLYILFLISPLVLSPIVNSYSGQVKGIIKTSTGFDAELDGLGIVTSPNLSAGIKVKSLSLSTPVAEAPFFTGENAGVKLSLLPLIVKKIRIDSVYAKNLNAELLVKKDGNFQILDYLPKTEETSNEAVSLPFNFKLSNHLPNVKINNYKLGFVDGGDNKSYFIEGKDFKIKDFILNKNIKLSTKGKVVFDNETISNYDIKLFNKIMPNLELHDLVFPEKQPQIDTDKNLTATEPLPIQFNIIDIFKSIKNNKLKADLLTDIKTSGTIKEPHIKGHLRVDALSTAVNGEQLPESYADLIFKGKKTEIDSIFYTSKDENEKTQIIGNIISGKKPAIDMTLRSNAQFNNIIRLIDSIAQSFDIDAFSTLSATGGIDADFNLNSDMKKVSSTGYLKIKPSKISYSLYNVVIDNIKANIDFMNNNVNITQAGFSILGHPLNLSGSIKSDSSTDLKLTADKLSIKGLLAAFGQAALLKDNDFAGGTLSMNTKITGKLSEIKPDVNVSVDNLNILNTPSMARVMLSNALLKLNCDKKSISGDIDINSLAIKHPSGTVSIPKTKILANSKDVNIKNSYILLNNSRIDVNGNIKNYLNDKMAINVKAKGNIATSDIAGFIPSDVRSMFPYAGQLPLSVLISGNAKAQNIGINLTANDANYLKLADIDLLKGKTTKIAANMKIAADNLTFSKSGIFANNHAIATLSGGISKLTSTPKLNMSISVPQNISFPIPGMNNSNITGRGNLSILGDFANPQIKGTVTLPDISIKDMDFSLSNLTAHLNGAILDGTAEAKQFKFGGIIAENLSSKFALVDYKDFYLKDLTADAFDGKINGKIAYGILNSAINVDITGKNLNSTNAVYGAVGIKNALTGNMAFNAKLAMQGVTDKEIIESMKGNIKFNINDGRFLSIGRLENLVAAQNVSSNSILKTAISSLSTLSTIQETDKFKTIDGDIEMKNGTAKISNIKVTGPLMAYYVYGNYNILPNSANLIILGRLDAKVVSALGVLGELSAEKLLSYIPKFGNITSNILKTLTADPANEKTELIPQLSNGSTKFKDFKVVFNGPVESAASVKNFKWLSKCEITPIDTAKELQKAKDAVKTNIINNVENAKTNAQNVKNNVNNIIETQKNRIQAAKEHIEQSKIDLEKAKENAQNTSGNFKNLLKNAIEKSNTKMPETSTTPGASE